MGLHTEKQKKIVRLVPDPLVGSIKASTHISIQLLR